MSGPAPCLARPAAATVVAPVVGDTNLRDIPPPPLNPAGKPRAPQPAPAPDPNRLPAELIAQLRELDASGRRITAFKTYREYTGVGFREAEEQVKKILDG